MSPCCGISLQTGTKIVAILDLVYGILEVANAAFTLRGGTLETFFFENDQIQVPVDEREEVASAGAAETSIGQFTIVFGIVWILPAALLLSGAIKRDRSRCMIWFVINEINLLLSLLLFFVTSLATGHTTAGEILVEIIEFVIYFYFLWVVSAFMAELKEAVEVASYGSPKPPVQTTIEIDS